MILHFSQIGFTDALTFMPSSLGAPWPPWRPDSQHYDRCRTARGDTAHRSSSNHVAAHTVPAGPAGDAARPHLNLYVILPRCRSYGESSTFTLSPGRLRM